MKQINKHKTLQAELKAAGFDNPTRAICQIIGRSDVYVRLCLNGKRAFQPDEMRAIMEELPANKTTVELFPPFGIDLPNNHNKEAEMQLNALKSALSGILYGDKGVMK